MHDKAGAHCGLRALPSASPAGPDAASSSSGTMAAHAEYQPGATALAAGASGAAHSRAVPSRCAPATGTFRHPLRGRNPQRGRLEALLDSVSATGSGSVASIEGTPGSGASSLLSETCRTAADRGFQIVQGRADPYFQKVPLAPLLMSLPDLVALPEHAWGAAGDSSGPWLGIIEQLRGLLERRSRRAPVLVAVDDLQWADPVTRWALRALPPRLADRPVLWLTAHHLRRPGADASERAPVPSGRFTRITLEPLDFDEVTGLAQDLLGAGPGSSLRALLSQSDGNPGMAVALVQGLAEEGTVRVEQGIAQLTASPAAEEGFAARAGDGVLLPARFLALVRRQVDALGPRTGQLLRVGAVLGPSFGLDDLTGMLGEPVAALVPVVREALDSGLVRTAEDGLAFRHELPRRALLEDLPEPLRGALHRQAAAMLLDGGASVVRASVHLAHGARRGDAEAVDVLTRACAEILATDPGTAAELALRGIELVGPGDPTRASLAAAAVEALTRQGRPERAIEVAREALGRPESESRSTALRCGVATAHLLAGRPEDAVASAATALTEVRDLADGGLNSAALVHLAGLLGSDAPSAPARARDLVADGGRGSAGLRAGARAAHADTLWRQGMLTEALREAAEAARKAPPAMFCAPPCHPGLTHATLLTRAGRREEARAALAALAEGGAGALSPAVRLLGASVDLAHGRTREAVQEATASLERARGLGVPLYTPLGWYVLGTAALRGGDVGAAERHAQHCRDALAAHDAPSFRARCAWLTAQVAKAQGRPEATADALREVLEAPAAALALLAELPAAGAWIAREVPDAGTARPPGGSSAAALRTALCRVTPEAGELPQVDAAAAHARGVLKQDPDRLRHAAAGYTDPWATASAEEDLAVLLSAGDQQAAVGYLERAAGHYAEAGGDRDTARVRQRLREAGVRRRHWVHTKRPATGWGSLTRAERAVARLVAQGLTNRQAAEQMFLSPHTVSFHLRQVFRKLGIRSRVDLARLSAGETPQSGAAVSADAGPPRRERTR
jgi:DNA-binding CsgD family transcriptional regulator/tetratricopeptide (TPR) repeat protein